jgi:hypothetical protein
MSNPYGIDDRRRIEQFKGWVIPMLWAVPCGIVVVLVMRLFS